MNLFQHPAPIKSGISTVLIVEDEPLVAFENEHALAQAGYRVVATVDRHADARAALAAGGIDLVVADIALSGGGNGIDVARDAGEYGIPVLFVTGHCPEEARTLAIGCLAKPYAPRDLVRAIRVAEGVIAGEQTLTLPLAMTLF